MTMPTDRQTRPWTCVRCGERLAWTSTTVGCRPCRTVIVLQAARSDRREDEHVKRVGS